MRETPVSSRTGSCGAGLPACRKSALAGNHGLGYGLPKTSLNARTCVEAGLAGVRSSCSLGTDLKRAQRRPSPLRLVLLFATALAFAVPVLDESGARTRSYAIMDFESGVILAAVNEDKRLHPASLTKMMTLYLSFEAIRDGRFSLDQRVRVSKRAASMPPSRLGLRTGQRVRLRHLIAAAAVRSANDAAVVLAETVGGTEWKFAEMMTRKARSFGMSGTTFKNATGFTANGHLSTARDMAILGRRLLRDFPEHASTFGRLSIRWGGRVLRATNSRFLQAFKGADGIKTGYTRAAGYTMVATAERNGRRLVTSYFGASSSGRRASRVSELMAEGFDRLKTAGTLVAQPAHPPTARPGAQQVETPALASVSSPAETPFARPGAVSGGGRSTTAPETHFARPDAVSGGGRSTTAAETPFARPGAVSGGGRSIPPASVDAPSTSGVPLDSPDGGPEIMEIASAGRGFAEASSSGAEGRWSIQVGAYSRKEQAEARLGSVSAAHADVVGNANSAAPKRRRYYLAQFTGFQEDEATSACRTLRSRRVDCLPIVSLEAVEPAAVTAGVEMPDSDTAIDAPAPAATAPAPAATAPSSTAVAAGGWAVQVGAYSRKRQAESHLQNVNSAHADITGRATPLTPRRNRYYLAQFAGFGENEAKSACRTLRQRGVDCLPIIPSGEWQPAAPAAAAETILPNADRQWAIQVGAYALQEQAEAHLRRVSGQHGDIIRDTTPLAPKRSRYYLAQFSGFGEDEAKTACGTLRKRGVDCLPLAPVSTGEPAAIAAASETVLRREPGTWAIQVGAYSRKEQAEAHLRNVSAAHADVAGNAAPIVPRRNRYYLAQLAGFDEETARSACGTLRERGVDCLPLAPSGTEQPVFLANADEAGQAHAPGQWAVQVGAFGRAQQARAQIDTLRRRGLPGLSDSQFRVARSGRLYLAWFTGFDESSARETCRVLEERRTDCLAVRTGPERIGGSLTADAGWTIQIGAFRRDRDANRHLDRMQRAGFPELEGREGSVNRRGRYHLVQFEPFNSAEARSACDALVKRGIDCLARSGGNRNASGAGRADWAIQVGAYRRATQARAQLNRVMGRSLSELEGARHWVPQQGRLYLARLRNLSRQSANAACDALRSDGVDCLPLAPSTN